MNNKLERGRHTHIYKQAHFTSPPTHCNPPPPPLNKHRSDWPLFSSVDGVFVNLSVKIWGNKVQTAIITKCSPFCVDQHLHTQNTWSAYTYQHQHTQNKTKYTLHTHGPTASYLKGKFWQLSLGPQVQIGLFRCGEEGRAKTGFG